MDLALLRFALEQCSGFVIIVDHTYRIVFASRTAATQLERTVDGLVGRSVADIVGEEGADELTKAIQRAIRGNEQRADGGLLLGVEARGEYELRFVPAPPADSGGEVTNVVLFLETPEQFGMLRTFGGMEQQDPVTGLLNRHSLPLVIRRELYRAGRTGPVLALLFVMLHDFKQINQMYGHQVGDLLLENTGLRIRETVRKSDYVFRWEGTNLVVLLPELATRLDALVVAEKIHSAVTVPYRFRDLDLAPGCHVGISLYPDDARDADGLFNCANSAVIEAERIKEPFLYFDRSVHRQASDRLALKTALKRAFERDELELYYQPIVRPDGRIAGAEALMRWNHPQMGLLGPESFIEIAEDSRLIAPIDKLALYQACRQLVRWNDLPEMFLTLNVSAINLSDASLPLVVAQAIEDTGLSNPSRLKLELTESRTVENSRYSNTAMHEIQAMGIEIWIDDFGTGQSSLSYLKHLPVTVVKIDKDFVSELGESPTDEEYLKGIVNTVRSRGKQVVVEGISTKQQLSLVETLPVDYLQGFYFAKPMPSGELNQLLNRERSLPMLDLV